MKNGYLISFGIYKYISIDSGCVSDDLARVLEGFMTRQETYNDMALLAH